MLSTANAVRLEGNLTRNPELRFTPKGTAICEFSIAYNRYYRDNETGDFQEVTSFFDCRLFGVAAQDTAEKLQKGYKVSLTGSLEQERWRDRDDNPHSRIWVDVDEFSVLRRPQKTNRVFQNEPPASEPVCSSTFEPVRTEVFFSMGE